MQFPNFELHLAQFLAKVVANSGTCFRLAGSKTDEFVDFLQRKSQPLHLTDKYQGFDLLRVVESKAARTAPWRSQQPSPFIETDGIDGESTTSRKLPDSHAGPLLEALCYNLELCPESTGCPASATGTLDPGFVRKDRVG
jgi:hypothetical protein